MKVTYRKDHDEAHNYKIEFLQALTDHAEKLIRAAAADPDLALMKEWFGVRNVTSTDSEVYKVVALAAMHLDRWCDKGTIHFVGKNYKGSLAACDWTNDKREFFLNAAFPLKRWSWGERVCTLLHEFSHKVLETKDETYKGEPAYGMKCLELSKDVTEYESAVTNAENWGYYLCSYRVKAGLATKLFDRKDETWQWLHKSDWMGGRTPFLSDVEGQKLDTSLLSSIKKVVAKKSIKMVSKSKDDEVVKKPLKSKKKSSQVLCPHCNGYFSKVASKYHIETCSEKKE